MEIKTQVMRFERFGSVVCGEYPNNVCHRRTSDVQKNDYTIFFKITVSYYSTYSLIHEAACTADAVPSKMLNISNWFSS